MPTQVNPGRDRGEYSRNVEPFRREVGQKRSEERDGDLNRRIVETSLNPPHDEAGDTTEGDKNKASGRCSYRKFSRQCRRDRELQGDEGSGVVDQALAFENGFY